MKKNQHFFDPKMTKCRTRLILHTETTQEKMLRVAIEVEKRANSKVDCVQISKFKSGTLSHIHKVVLISS